MLAKVRAALGSLDRVKRIVKVLGMVNTASDFGDQPKVVNGFSDLMVEVFGEEVRARLSADRLCEDWLFGEYRANKVYLEKVAPRSRPDYERTMLLVADIVTKKGDRIGSRPVRTISPVSADKIYDIICRGPRGPRPRQGEKAIALCRRGWRVVHRLHPKQFNQDVSNPWDGVTEQRRTKATKAAVTREQVYAFAWGCIEHGQPEVAAVAVICFEWLQRPENVVSGYLRWPDYRSKEWPNAIRIEHHKTRVVVWHPLEEVMDNGIVKFYEDAEAVLLHLPRRGVPMILRDVSEGITKPYSFGGMQKIVQTMRARLDCLPLHARRLPSWRHDRTGRGRADRWTGTRPFRAQESAGIRRVRQTHDGTLSATRKRHAHRLTNATGA
jgi:hypothetical protein